MSIKLSIAVSAIAFILVFLTACNQKPETVTAASEQVEQGTAPAPRPTSMRVSDVRIAIGARQTERCNIERANGTLFWPEQPRVSKTDTVEISGWIVNEATQSVPDNVKLRLQTANGHSAWEQDVVERQDRPDVAKNLGVDAYRKAGFRISLDVADLVAGDYVVYLAYDGPVGESICGIGRRLTLTP
jgi:hypothetical protein